MDKRKVIQAYRAGLITRQQCAQILGIESARVFGLVSESWTGSSPRTERQPLVH